MRRRKPSREEARYQEWRGVPLRSWSIGLDGKLHLGEQVAWCGVELHRGTAAGVFDCCEECGALKAELDRMTEGR